ncbi:hypothetical protein LQZ21_01010 [Treponema sp. TIM-1]|uniref:hypothetical protein n=1 Tax=Treponema sp. TIM-1 TaxID=2898417 RepID=UPI00398104CF
MRTILLPLYFTEANERENGERRQQLAVLKELYGDEAEFLPEQALGTEIPGIVDALLFPQLIGAIFSHKAELAAIRIPIVVLTSSFGTVEMWDWEIVSYLRLQLKLNVFTPYNVDLAKVILRSLAAKKLMQGGVNFLMFQDEPGEGMQAYIFKRFYWWEAECTRFIEDAFGIKILYQSWKGVNERAREIPDQDATALWEQWTVPTEDLPRESVIKAVKLYLAIKEVIDKTGNVYGVGGNCLNESFHSDTTPCLAWNWIFEHDRLIWACEGDTVTLISKFILYSGLKRPMMMTNIYPFLVGMAALKHEGIDTFPDIDDPDNHALGVHCGYFGFAPQSFCTHWVMRPKALAIVNDHAVVIDCRIKTGPVTMAKLQSDMKGLTIIEAEIEDYVQYPGSDCRNGALIRYKNKSGHRVMEELSSHHAIIIQGDITHELVQMAKVYGFTTRIV